MTGFEYRRSQECACVRDSNVADDGLNEGGGIARRRRGFMSIHSHRPARLVRPRRPELFTSSAEMSLCANIYKGTRKFSIASRRTIDLSTRTGVAGQPALRAVFEEPAGRLTVIAI